MNIESIQRYFAFYGFIECPLDEEQIKVLLDLKLTKNQIYEIGCDYYCGYSNERLKQWLHAK